MADNVNITAGTGTVVAADDIGGGVLAQRIKLVLGPDGTGNDALAGSGVNGTGVQRVTIATDDTFVSMITAPATGTISSVNSTTSDQTILASNVARKGAYVYNDSTQVMYLALASVTASTANFTQKLAAGDAYNIPAGGYTGALKGLWAASNGSARVTEWTS